MSAAAFRTEWTKVAKEQGIVNPYKFFKPSSYEFDEEGRLISDVDFGSYSKMRDEYVARRVFEEEGFAAFEVQTCGGLEYLRDKPEFVPCKSADGQCSLFCSQRKKCQHWH